MSKRTDFSIALARLIIHADELGYLSMIDYVKRSTEEQQRLFKLKLSKCDGIKNRSYHQNAQAGDVYFSKKDTPGVINYNICVEMHEYWVSLGGEPMIDWDKSHFELR
jgi:hypothetical protein